MQTTTFKSSGDIAPLPFASKKDHIGESTGQFTQYSNLHLRLPEITEQNILTLWNYTSGELDVDEKGRIFLVAFYHIRSRMTNWFTPQNVITNKVHQAIMETFKEIHLLMQQGYSIQLIEKTAPQNLENWDSNNPLECYTSQTYDMGFLVNKVTNQFLYDDIQTEATLLLENEKQLQNSDDSIKKLLVQRTVESWYNYLCRL
jgi:hypothetical protein